LGASLAREGRVKGSGNDFIDRQSYSEPVLGEKLIRMRATCLLAAILVCAGTGCERKTPSALRQLANMPELYWEQARACKEKQIRNGDEECRVDLEEARGREQEKVAAERRR
jgi:hypothetical protein